MWRTGIGPDERIKRPKIYRSRSGYCREHTLRTDSANKRLHLRKNHLPHSRMKIFCLRSTVTAMKRWLVPICCSATRRRPQISWAQRLRFQGLCQMSKPSSTSWIKSIESNCDGRNLHSGLRSSVNCDDVFMYRTQSRPVFSEFTRTRDEITGYRVWAGHGYPRSRRGRLPRRSHRIRS